MTSVRLRDEVLDTVETARGKPIVLLHSLLADRAIFDKIVPALGRQRRVIVPDLPGFGASSSAGATIEGIADRIAGLFDALRPRNDGRRPRQWLRRLRRQHAGHSSWRAIRPARCLADTGVGFSPEGKQSFYAMAERVRQSGMEAIVDVALKRLFPEDFIAVNPDIMAERRNALVKTNPQFFAGSMSRAGNARSDRRYRKIRNPTLVVVGEHDAATPPEMARMLARALPKADLIEMPGCGHAPMAQAPEAFIRLSPSSST